jgi:hypothetical protein
VTIFGYGPTGADRATPASAEAGVSSRSS